MSIMVLTSIAVKRYVCNKSYVFSLVHFVSKFSLLFQVPAEPVNDVLKDMFPDMQATPTGI